MTRKPVVFTHDSGNKACIDVPAIPDWAGFDKLMEFLVVHYAAVVVELVDGPDCRKARLRISGEDVEVIHDDPYGNTIRACDIGANVIVKSVANDLLGRLVGF